MPAPRCVPQNRLVLPPMEASLACASAAGPLPTEDPELELPTVEPPEPPGGGGGCSGSPIVRDNLIARRRLIVPGASVFVKLVSPNFGLKINEWAAMDTSGGGLLLNPNNGVGYFSGAEFYYGNSFGLGFNFMNYCHVGALYPIGSFRVSSRYAYNTSLIRNTDIENFDISLEYKPVGVSAQCQWVVSDGIFVYHRFRTGGNEGKWGYFGTANVVGRVDPDIDITITGDMIVPPAGHGGPLWSRDQYGNSYPNGQPGISIPASFNPFSGIGRCPINTVGGSFTIRVSSNPS